MLNFLEPVKYFLGSGMNQSPPIFYSWYSFLLLLSLSSSSGGLTGRAAELFIPPPAGLECGECKVHTV